MASKMQALISHILNENIKSPMDRGVSLYETPLPQLYRFSSFGVFTIGPGA